jgi:phosphoglycerol transferase MdoB-like AlkP superfamily enzyme
MDYWKSSIQRLFITFLSIIVLLLTGRIFFFLDYLPTDFWGKASWFEVILVFLSATRFDVSTASAVILLPVLGTLLLMPFSKSLRKPWRMITHWYSQICLYTTVLIIIVSHYFFYYYQDHFNSFFWEFWDNWVNSKYVIWSIFDELPMIKLSISLLMFLVFLNLIPKIINPLISPLSILINRKVSMILIPLALLIGVRGTLDMLPLSKQRYREQVSAITHLNLIHGNPYYELYTSWGEAIDASDFSKVKKFLKRSTNKIPGWFATIAELDDGRKFRGVDESTFFLEYEIPALRKKYLKQKPKHIVFIFMESQADWLSNYKEGDFLHKIRKNLEQIKKESLSFNHFFQAGILTIDNIMKINLSIPTNNHYQIAFYPEIYKPFSTTFPRIMERQGYIPLFFHGGSLNEGRLYSLIPKLGYQKIFGESSIQNVAKTRFGVHDGDLFELVHQKLMKAKQPTFSFVMTLSNHPPYEVPENFVGQVTSSNAPSKLKKRILEEGNFDKRMRALAYADQALGGFFRKAKKSPYFKETLFVLTADHSHPMALKWEPEERYQLRKIPLFFYSPALLKTPNTVNDNFGSHIDIPPTILSLITEKPVMVHSWGRSLLVPPKSKLLLSSGINCFNDVCLASNKVYVLQKDQKLVLCKTPLCLENSKHLTKIINAFSNSASNYLFNYRIVKSE